MNMTNSPAPSPRLTKDQVVVAALHLAMEYAVPIEKVIEARYITSEQRQKYESGGGVWTVIMAESVVNAPGDLSEICIVSVEDESGQARFVETL